MTATLTSRPPRARSPRVRAIRALAAATDRSTPRGARRYAYLVELAESLRFGRWVR